MITNKRAVERFEFFIVVEFKSEKEQAEPYLGITRNFSREGFSFESRDFAREPGETLEFTFRQPQSDLIVPVQGEIIWKERSDKLQCFTGIKFRDADENKIWKIMEIVSAAGIVTSEFIHDDKSVEVFEDNGAEPEGLKEAALSSKEPVRGNGEVFAEAETITAPGPQPVTMQKIETEKQQGMKPETAPKKRIPLFVSLAAFIFGIALFMILKEYSFEKPLPVFTELLSSVETEEGPVLTGDAGTVQSPTGPDGDGLLPEQEETPHLYRTITETASSQVAETTLPISFNEDAPVENVSGDAGPPQAVTTRQEDRLLPGLKRTPDVPPNDKAEILLPETVKKQKILFAGDLVKDKPPIQKSVKTENQQPVPEKERRPVEKEKAGDITLLSSEMRGNKQNHGNNMQVAMVPDIVASGEQKTVNRQREKKPVRAPSVPSGDRDPKKNKGEYDSSEKPAAGKISVKNDTDTNVDSGETFADIPEKKEEETAVVKLNETVPGKELKDGSGPDSTAVFQDEKGSQTAALYETPAMKKERIDIFEELFDNNAGNWDVINTYAASANIEGGEYTIENKRKKGAHYIFRHDEFPHDQDFLTEVDMKAAKTIYSHSYGFVLGAQDVYNNYVFRVINNSYFLISKYHKGVLRNLAGGTIEKGILREHAFNTLRIEKKGSIMRFYMNNQFISEISNFSFYGNKIGFILEGKLKISVDRIYARIISYQ